MKTIKERAEDYANENWTLDEANFACEDGYIKGATEQKQIDDQHILFLADSHEHEKKMLIDKACEWLNKNWRGYTGVDRYGVINFYDWENDFRKAMKEE